MVLTSIWQDRNDPFPASGHVSDEADVVVVGGGITGLTTALLLARGGRSVTLIEAYSLGSGTTGRSTAKLSVLQGARLAQVHSRQTSGLLCAYVAANREALAWLTRFGDEHGVGYERRDDHAYAVGNRGERTARKVLEAAAIAGLEAEWVDDVALPFATRGAVRLPDQVQLDPLEMVRALAQQAAAHGVQLVEHARVRRVSGSDPVTVSLVDGRSVRTGHVVIATGMPMADRGAYFARMTPARSYSVAFRGAAADPGVDGMFISLDGPSRSLRDAPGASGGRVLLVGGSGHTTGRGPAPVEHLDELRGWAGEHFPGAVETHAWSAQDYLTHHGLPYAGPLLPGGDRVLVAGGFSKWGLTNGVAAAQVLAARVLGGDMPWAGAFETWSPREARGLGRGLVANGEVGLQMARSWMSPLTHLGKHVPDEGQGHVEPGDLGRAPVAVAQVDGQVRRTSAVCTHLGGVVRWNDAERSWDCPLHGSRFGTDGEVLEGPATCGLARRDTSDA